MRPGSWQHRSHLMLSIRVAPLVTKAREVESRDRRTVPAAAHVRAVVQVLLNRCDSAGVAWPSTASIARDAEVSRATVARSLALLVDAGVVHRLPSAGRSTRYRIDWMTVGSLCERPPELTNDLPQREAPQREAPQREAPQCVRRHLPQPEAPPASVGEALTDQELSKNRPHRAASSPGGSRRVREWQTPPIAVEGPGRVLGFSEAMELHRKGAL